MRIGFIVLCRYDSSRLPGKVLREIFGKPILGYIYERLRCVADESAIVVATSLEETDLPIVEFCRKNRVNCFRGDLHNVAKRFLDCAGYHGFDFAVRINGDNFFTSPFIIRQMLPYVWTGAYDFLSNVKGRTFPKGMSVEILRTSFYQDLITRFERKEQFEHVTLYLYQNENEGKRFYFYNTLCLEATGVNLAIDSQEDYDTAIRLIAKIDKPHTEYDLFDWIELLKELKVPVT
jgi:spore coat polysaccharide biosynthesis protein SpsF